ncbi:MAG TPA: hypothetical protein VMM60_14790 [Ilumatobacter sp.]|nr:hypothetical protein [Ilumatobacter sp.]
MDNGSEDTISESDRDSIRDSDRESIRDSDRGVDADLEVPWWRRLDRGTVIACLFVAIGLAFVFRGLLVSVTGDDRSPLPANVEQVLPVPEAVQALSQTQVFADLAEGFTGTLSIDGIDIPTESIRDLATPNPQPGQQTDLPAVTIFEPGNATLTFTPSSGAPIESFGEGVHTVVMRYWNVEAGENSARVYTWTFNVV